MIIGYYFFVGKEKEPKFKLLFSKEKINRRVVELGKEIAADYEGEELIVVGILKGAFMFMADLIREIESAILKVDFMRVSSYGSGQESSRQPKIVQDLSMDISGKHVLIVEDIVDTGYSMKTLLKILEARGPASLKTCAFLSKPDRREVEVSIDYLGFEIPDVWVEGYGLDTDHLARNKPNIVIRSEG